MASLYLGVTEGSAIELPPIRWLGERPHFPISIHREISAARMIDGSMRYGFYGASLKREWSIEWNFIAKSALDNIIGLYGQNQALKFKNEHESNTWYTVIFSSLTYSPVRVPTAGSGYYSCSIVLREA